MIAEFSAALGSLKAITDLAKGLNAASTQAQINEVKLALQGHLLDAQSALMAAQSTQSTASERIRDLEQQIMQFKDWEAEKKRYDLQAIDAGAFAYALKPGMEGGEPPHWLCANCFGKRQKSILQSRGQIMTVNHRDNLAKWGCNTCGDHVVVNYTRKPSDPPWAPRVSPP